MGGVKVGVSWLVEAFIYSSEDALTTNFQSEDHLYVHVAEVAKTCHNEDWM
jgi:hypothetical protein